MATLFGRYEYAGELGRGASGRVFAVRDRADGGAARAVKVVPGGEEGRLLWEFARLCEVEHPRLAKVRELLRLEQAAPSPFGLPRAALLLVEDFVSGTPLSQLLQLREQPAERGALAARAAVDVLDALTALHDGSLVHGDVKPDNVLWAETGEGATLIDLGFARPPALASVPRGTPAYMAPELFAGVCTPAADVYAVAALLYDGLLGEAPDARASGAAAPWQARDPARLEGVVSAPLARVVGQLLAPDPSHRPADAHAALSALLPALLEQGWVKPGLAQASRGRLIARGLRSGSERAERAYTLPFVGHQALLARLSALLAPSEVVLVRGLRGAGRSRLVREAIRARQAQRARAGEHVPTWVSSLDALAVLRDVDAIAWLQAGEGESVESLVRSASVAKLAVRSLCVVVECAAEERLEGAQHVDVPALPEDEFAQLLAALIAPERALREPPSRELSRAARQSALGLGGRLCELCATLLQSERDLRDPRAWEAAASSPSEHALSPALSGPAETLATALAWWGAELLPTHAAQLLSGESSVRAAYDELRARSLLSEQRAGLAVLPAFARQLRARTLAPARALAPRLTALGCEARGSFARLLLDDREAAVVAFAEEAQALRGEGRTDAACALLDEARGWLDDARLALLSADAERARGSYEAGLAALAGRSESAARLLRAELLRLSDRAPAAQRELDALLESGDPCTLARAQAQRARLLFDAGALEPAQRALAEARASDDREAELRALEVAVLLALYGGELAEAPVELLLTRATEGVGRDASGFVTRAPARALALRAQLLSRRGRARRALHDLRAAVAQAEAAGESHEAATYTLNLGLAELECGELGRALETLRDAAARLARAARPRDLARVLFNFAALALLTGDLDRAELVLSEAERELARTPDHVARGLVGVLRAELFVHRGALEAAERELSATVEQLPEAARSTRRLAQARAAQVAVARGALGRAESLFALACSTEQGEELGLTLELLLTELSLALAAGQPARAESCAQRGLALISSGALAGGLLEPGLHGESEGGVAFADRLRFVLGTVEAARTLGSASVQRERSALARAWLERALATLPSELRQKMRSVPAYARVLSSGSYQREPLRGELPERWRSLVRAARRLFTESSERRLVQGLAEIALELVHAERALVISFDEQHEPYVLARAELAREGERRSAFSRSVIERVALDGEPLLTVEAQSDARLSRAESVSSLSVRSVLCLELLGREERSFLYLDDRLRPSAFGSEDLSLLADLVELARQALQSAEQLRSEARRARRAEQQQKRLRSQLARVQATPGRDASSSPLVGESPALSRVVASARRVALSDAPVLITGESGTGKELLARFVHEVSARRARAFVAESCAAMPDALLESTLFGHVRGAYTGAERARKGLFETADGGTLFLDEVGEMSASLQGKLLRVLQEGELRPLGSDQTRSVDVRVIGATRSDLSRLVQAGRFREDLYYRLAVVTLELPPLRERPEDVAPLVAHFLEKHARGRKVRVEPEALRALESRAWPGNVRELENELRRALALGDSEIGIEQLSLPRRSAEPEAESLDLHARVDALTRSLVRDALARAEGNITHAAALLGVSRFGLQKILKRLQLSAK